MLNPLGVFLPEDLDGMTNNIQTHRHCNLYKFWYFAHACLSIKTCEVETAPHKSKESNNIKAHTCSGQWQQMT